MEWAWQAFEYCIAFWGWTSGLLFDSAFFLIPGIGLLIVAGHLSVGWSGLWKARSQCGSGRFKKSNEVFARKRKVNGRVL